MQDPAPKVRAAALGALCALLAAPNVSSLHSTGRPVRAGRHVDTMRNVDSFST